MLSGGGEKSYGEPMSFILICQLCGTIIAEAPMDDFLIGEEICSRCLKERKRLLSSFIAKGAARKSSRKGTKPTARKRSGSQPSVMPASKKNKTGTRRGGTRRRK